MALDRSQNRSALYGGIIMLVIVALSVLIFSVGHLGRVLKPSIEVIVLADDVGALSAGGAVWIAGHEVGTVSSVELRKASHESERIAVRARIPKKHAGHVRRDSEARLTSRRLIGDPVLDILPGSASAPAIRDGDTLHMRKRATVAELMERSEALTASFAQFFGEMKDFEPKMSRRTPRDLDRVAAGLRGVLGEFRTLMVTLDETPMQMFSDPEWNRLLEHLSASGKQLSEELSRAAQRARAAGSDARPALQRMAARADTISAVLNDLKQRVESGGGGFLIRAQRDSAIVKHLHEAKAQLDSLMVESKRNPLRFWF